MRQYDVVIVGGGPAGLSAALLLGRSRRRVLLCDSARPRNATSHALNAFITRDGVDPDKFRRVARAQLKRYSTVELRRCEVTDASRRGNGFAVVLRGGDRVRSRALLLATGQIDVLPAVTGAAELYGRGVFPCPYCDGWEKRDQLLAVYGSDQNAMELALALLDCKSTFLCTDGPSALTAVQRRRLARHRVKIVSHRIVRLEGDEVGLNGIWFANGDALPAKAMFFHPVQRQQSSLAVKLGCRFNKEGAVICDGHSRTNVPGVHVAGNTRCGLQLAIMAAAEGAEAAYVIHSALLEADYR